MLEQLVASRMFHDTRIYVPLARGPEKGRHGSFGFSTRLQECY